MVTQRRQRAKWLSLAGVAAGTPPLPLAVETGTC
jgi:hypothetical protein